jgi:two-component system response regulator DesR
MGIESGARRRVLVADDKPEVRSALRLLLSEQPDLEVVAEAGGVEGLLAKAEQTMPDMVMVDWELPCCSGLKNKEGSASLIANLRSRVPGLSVVVLGGWPELGKVALTAGADGFVSKCDPPDRVLVALRQATQF